MVALHVARVFRSTYWFLMQYIIMQYVERDAGDAERDVAEGGRNGEAGQGLFVVRDVLDLLYKNMTWEERRSRRLEDGGGDFDMHQYFVGNTLTLMICVRQDGAAMVCYCIRPKGVTDAEWRDEYGCPNLSTYGRLRFHRELMRFFVGTSWAPQEHMGNLVDNLRNFIGDVNAEHNGEGRMVWRAEELWPRGDRDAAAEAAEDEEEEEEGEEEEEAEEEEEEDEEDEEEEGEEEEEEEGPFWLREELPSSSRETRRYVL